MNFRSRNVSEALPSLLSELLEQPETTSRNGSMRELRFAHLVIEQPCERVVTTPGRGALHVAQIAETMWILAGRNDAEWLSNYLPRALEFSDDGVTWRGGYGPRIRHWRGKDQLKHVIDLLNEERDTRRALISIYDAELDSMPGKDIPCNNWLHFLPRGDILDLHVATRSNDVIWGWSGINAYEWSVLLEVVASLTGFLVGQLHFSISSLHLYERHYKKAAEIVRKAPMSMPIQPQPDFTPRMRGLEHLDILISKWFQVEEDIRNDVVGAWIDAEFFPEPLMRSWLKVIRKHWEEKRKKDQSVAEAAAQEAEKATVQPAHDSMLNDFREMVAKLHREKDAAYGTSWKKRGEQLSIMANICRKADRLDTAKSTPDESQIDTAIDLFVYAMKYKLWLCDEERQRDAQDLEVGEVIRHDEDPRFIDALIHAWEPRGVNPEFDKVALSVSMVEDLAAGGLNSLQKSVAVRALVEETGMLAFQRWLAGEEEYRGADQD